MIRERKEEKKINGKIYKVFFLVLIVFWLVNSSIYAKTIYVSKSGDDDNDGHSPQKALVSVKTAIFIAETGDTILVDDGVYLEKNIVIKDKDIILKSIKGPLKTIIDAKKGGRVIIFTNSYSTLEGFTIQGGYMEGYSWGSAVRIHYKDAKAAGTFIIRNNIIQNNESPDHTIVDISVCPKLTLILEENIFRENMGGGYEKGGPSAISMEVVASAKIKNNLFVGPSSSEKKRQDLISIYKVPTIFTNNTITNFNPGKKGAVFQFHTKESGELVEISNCIIWGNNIGKLFLGDIYPKSITYSCIQWPLKKEGNFAEYPKFVNPAEGDYHLMPNSPCIDTGNPDVSFNDPDGTRSDIGRFYFKKK